MSKRNFEVTCKSGNNEKFTVKELGKSELTTITREKMIENINSGGYSYKIGDSEIHVYADKYLRTDRNSTSKDNLDNLKEC